MEATGVDRRSNEDAEFRNPDDRLFSGRMGGGSLRNVVLAAGGLGVASIDQQFSQIAADFADLSGSEAVAAQVDTFDAARGGHSTNQNSHRPDVSTRVTMPLAAKVLYT
jgi:hypothetical protein